MIHSKTKITPDIGSQDDNGENGIDHPIYHPNISVGSQIKEPNIVGSHNNGGNSANNNNNNNNHNHVIPSATTDSTKNYVGGGVTPDSNIVVNKPKTNHLFFGLIVVVGAYMAYKMFVDEKSE